MLQVRKLVLAVAAATSMASGMAHALGLGEISVKSALNEPLVAEIELLETKGLTSEEIRSQLASAADFSRSGIDRSFFLTNLKFTPVIRPDGKSFVRVTSNQAVREPFLNFLLEVYWPAGRMLKEFTLLLDPPLYSPQELVYSEAPAVAPVSKPVSTTPVAPRPATPAAIARTPAAQPAAPALQGDQYRVQKNDTLWEIAVRAGAGRGSVHQTMLAIQDLNPNAFIDGNINKLKNGQLLKLPSAEQVRKRSRGQAVAEFQSQVDSWRAGAGERQLDARRRDTAAAAPARVEQGDNLRLVAAASGESAVASDSGAGNRELRDQLALAKEQLDSTRIQNQDLNSRVDELSNQVEKLQRLLELKNTQLANLQNMSEPVAEVVTPQPVEPVAAEPEVVVETPVSSADLGEMLDVQPELDVDSLEAAEPAVEVEPALAAEPEPAAVAAVVEQPVEAKPAETKPAVVVDPVPAPKSFLDELLENPLVLPGAGAGAAALVLLLLWSRRRASKQDEPQAEVLPPEEVDGDEVVADLDTDKADGEDFANDMAALDGMLNDLNADPEEPAEFLDAVDKAPADAASDPIAEAENYISFGRFSQAASVLLKAIDADPQLEELRFKLLEVYADLEDRNAFTGQVDELMAMGVAQSKLDGLRQRFPHLMGEEDELGMAEAGISAASDPLADEIPDLDDLLNDELFTSADAEPVVALDSADEDDFSKLLEAAEAELDDPFSLDKGIDYTPEPIPAVDTAAADEAGGDEAEDFQLPGLDELTLEAFDAPEPAAELDDDLSLSLDDLQPLGDAASLSLDDLQPLDDEAPLSLDDAVAEQAADVLDDLDALILPDEVPESAGLDLDLDLDLSLPAETTTAVGDQDALDTSKLEMDLASLEASFDELQTDMESTLGDVADGMDELDALAADTDLDDLLQLDAGLDLSIPGLQEPETSAAVADELPAAGGEQDVMLDELEQSLDDDFAFLQGDDEDTTKLDLAAAWIDMGDIEGAREILDEVLREGAPEHQDRVRELMAKLG